MLSAEKEALARHHSSHQSKLLKWVRWIPSLAPAVIQRISY